MTTIRTCLGGAATLIILAGCVGTAPPVTGSGSQQEEVTDRATLLSSIEGKYYRVRVDPSGIPASQAGVEVWQPSTDPGSISYVGSATGDGLLDRVLAPRWAMSRAFTGTSLSRLLAVNDDAEAYVVVNNGDDPAPGARLSLDSLANHERTAVTVSWDGGSLSLFVDQITAATYNELTTTSSIDRR
jgi:hypothetical protein